MKIDREGDFWEPVIWFTREYAPFVWVVVGCLILGFVIVRFNGILSAPGKRTQIPYEWTCRSKYFGGYCERTGTNLGKPNATGTARGRLPN